MVHSFLSECLTVSEEPCVFPFTFGGVEHTKCTMDQSVNGLAWCATEVNETTGETLSGRWSDCRSESCPIECTCPEEELSLVCGMDGVTYSSECAAHCERVALNYPGECLPEGGQCRFSEDCRNFSSCNALQDASCVCLHGTCEVQVCLLISEWLFCQSKSGKIERLGSHIEEVNNSTCLVFSHIRYLNVTTPTDAFGVHLVSSDMLSLRCHKRYGHQHSAATFLL